MIRYIIRSLYGYWKKHPKPVQRIIIGLGYLYGFALICGSVFIIYYIYIRTGLYQYPAFQAAALIEIGLAYIGVRIPSRRFHLRGIIWVTALLAPFLIGTNIESLKPITGVGFIFLVFLGIFLTFQWYNSEKSKATRKTQPKLKGIQVPFSIITPAYLPEGYTGVEVNKSRRKKYSIVEHVYGRDDSEYIIWLKQADGPIPDSKPLKNMQVSDESIKGVPVSMAMEIEKPGSRDKRREEPLFIQANWTYYDINFNLRADGLSLPVVKQIIDSMIS